MKLTEGTRPNRVPASDLNWTVLEVIRRLNETEWYRGNGTADGQGIAIRTESYAGAVYNFTLRMAGSKARGSAVTFHGHRSVYACWHTHRDVMLGLFAMRPGARLVTGVIAYEGVHGFRCRFTDTYYDQVGSLAEPRMRGQMCSCNMSARVYHPSVRAALQDMGAVL